MCRAEGTPEPECPVDMFAEELLFDNQTQRYPNGVQGLRHPALPATTLSSFISGGYYPPLSERLLRRIIRLDGASLNDYGRVTFLPVLRLGCDSPRHIAAHHRHHRP